MQLSMRRCFRPAALRPYPENSERRPEALRPTLSSGLPFSGVNGLTHYLNNVLSAVIKKNFSIFLYHVV
jgi:hypothetical protein